MGAADTTPPTVSLANGELHAKVYLPDAKNGFYRGTRFDWSGVIYSLQFAGHDYYGPWFTKTDLAVHDFIYDGEDITAGPCSAITGPVDEFKPLGWDEAKPGGTFIKIGIGALRKTENAVYDNYHLYEIADGGRWHVSHKKDSLQFTQVLNDASSGFGYEYHKVVELTTGQPQMILRHTIKNTGSRAIHTSVYNHNFLVLDGKPTASGIVIKLPFQIESPGSEDKSLAEVRGQEIRYLKTLTGRETVAMPIRGFGAAATDHEIRIDNPALGAGMTIAADRPLESESLWSIRSVVAVEPFIAISIEPGKEFSWTTKYQYHVMGTAK
jgi:hypothetical protein